MTTLFYVYWFSSQSFDRQMDMSRLQYTVNLTKKEITDCIGVNKEVFVLDKESGYGSLIATADPADARHCSGNLLCLQDKPQIGNPQKRVCFYIEDKEVVKEEFQRTADEPFFKPVNKMALTNISEDTDLTMELTFNILPDTNYLVVTDIKVKNVLNNTEVYSLSVQYKTGED